MTLRERRTEVTHTEAVDHEFEEDLTSARDCMIRNYNAPPGCAELPSKRSLRSEIAKAKQASTLTSAEKHTLKDADRLLQEMESRIRVLKEEQRRIQESVVTQDTKLRGAYVAIHECKMRLDSIMRAQKGAANQAATNLRLGLQAVDQMVNQCCTKGLGPAEGSAAYKALFHQKWGVSAMYRYIEELRQSQCEALRVIAANRAKLPVFMTQAEVDPTSSPTQLQPAEASDDDEPGLLGNPDEGFFAADNLAEGPLAVDNPAEGPLAAGNPAEGPLAAGNPAEGPLAAGNPAEGPLAAGNPAEGPLDVNNPAEEETTGPPQKRSLEDVPMPRGGSHARNKVHRTGAVPESAAEAVTAAAVAAQAIPKPDDDADTLFARQLAGCGEGAYRAKTRSRTGTF